MLRRLVWVCCFPLVLAGQERIDSEVNARIRDEVRNRSQVGSLVHRIADYYGARVTGSPQLVAAGEWAVGQLREWGLENARLEPWDFGRQGWSSERVSAHLVSPAKDSLVAKALAWTPGTEGPVTAACVHFIPPVNPEQAELSNWLAARTGEVGGKVVLVGRHVVVTAAIGPPVLRLDEAFVRRRYWEPREEAGPAPRAESDGVPLPPSQVSDQIDSFLAANGAVARFNDSQLPYGQVRALTNRNYNAGATVPTLVLRSEDFGRIVRLLGSGSTVEVEIDVRNQTHPEGRTAYNAIAEISGTDRRDEVVMLGGHLDSWHSATGATDNASGVAVMMEVVRVFKALGLEPRRTVRIGLWSGEEQGLLGSQAYVRQQFGTAERPLAEFQKLSAYVNLDAGTGRIRGMTVFGPQEAAMVLRELVAPLAELGVGGAAATRVRRLASSDHSSFNYAGLPGITLEQDPLDYFNATWHTNLDTYERVVEDELKQCAEVVASLVYHLAARDAMLPRFGPGQLPAPGAASIAAPVEPERVGSGK